MSDVKQQEFMQAAIDLSIQKMRANEGGPFGAVIAKDGKIIAEGWNRVTSSCDPTNHAEIVAIRHACEKLDSFDLSSCEIYSSCEPCPMCLGAIYWARLDKLFFAATRADAARVGFDDSFIYDEIPKDINSRKIPTTKLLQDEAVKAFQEWDDKADKLEY